MINFLMFAKRDLSGADPVSYERLRQQWQLTGKDLIPLWPLLIALAVALGVLLYLRVRRRGGLRGMRAKPITIFYSVLEKSGLNVADKKLLVRLAHQQELPGPLTLLLSQGTFNHHTAAYLESIDPDRRDKLNERINRVRRVVFGAAQQA